MSVRVRAVRWSRIAVLTALGVAAVGRSAEAAASFLTTAPLRVVTGQHVCRVTNQNTGSAIAITIRVKNLAGGVACSQLFAVPSPGSVSFACNVGAGVRYCDVEASSATIRNNLRVSLAVVDTGVNLGKPSGVIAATRDDPDTPSAGVSVTPLTSTGPSNVLECSMVNLGPTTGNYHLNMFDEAGNVIASESPSFPLLSTGQGVAVITALSTPVYPVGAYCQVTSASSTLTRQTRSVISVTTTGGASDSSAPLVNVSSQQ